MVVEARQARTRDPIDVTFTRGRHDLRTLALFGDDLDAFLREDVLTGLFGDRWSSALCVEGDRAMLQVLAPPSPIGATGSFDVEPFFGYAGPALTPDRTAGFARRAFEAYRLACRERRIVAELIRFQPERQNQLPFQAVDGVSLHEGRQIAYVPVLDDRDEVQLGVYAPACRRQIRSARRRLQCRRMGRSRAAWQQFATLYRACLARNGATRRWYFDDAFFERMRVAEPVSLWGAFAESGELVSAAVVVAAKQIAHTLFVANAPPLEVRGANDLLTHEIVRAMREEGHRWVCLGGGRSSAADDSLLAFKRKFGPGHVRPLSLGFAVHDPRAYAALCEEAARAGPAAVSPQPSHELLARLMPYRLAASFADPGAAGEGDLADVAGTGGGR